MILMICTVFSAPLLYASS